MRNTHLSTALLTASVTALAMGAFGGAARADQPPARRASNTIALASPASPAADRPQLTGERGITRPAAGQPVQPFLAANEISAAVAPHSAELERCYLDETNQARRAAKLDLTLLIGRNGSLVSVKAAVPGLSAKASHKLATCAQSALEVVRFPERRNDTTAVLPYVFQKTDAPGAGPQLSCWNPKGCPGA